MRSLGSCWRGTSIPAIRPIFVGEYVAAVCPASIGHPGSVAPERDDLQQLELAFPRRVRSHLQPLGHIFERAELAPRGVIEAVVEGEPVSIPDRVYFQPVDDGTLDALTPTQRLMVDCLHTRHHDGLIRERHVRAVAASTEPWVPPFVLQLLGEYVLEVATAAAQAVPATSEVRSAFAAFCDANPEFLRLVRARATSYWNCYYRRTYPHLADYPPWRSLEELGA